MAVVWNAYHGGDVSYLSILYNVLRYGSVVDATTETATIEYNGQSVVVEGDIILNGGNIQAGMIHNLSTFDGDTLVAEASGYWLDIGVIGDVANELQSQLVVSSLPVRNMLNLQPITFHGSPDADSFNGGSFDDTLYGNGGADHFFGDTGDDYISGGKGGDWLFGGGGDDELRGGRGADYLIGRQGDDLMVGGGGDDIFSFSLIALGNGPGQAGVDTILDFNPGKDHIELDASIFVGIGNHLGSGEFHVGSAAEDGNDYIIYKANTGALFYDPDGDGPMGKIKFAVLDNKPDLSHDDFLMI
jgi:Ca2+-binding RTX toxin-like protein